MSRFTCFTVNPLFEIKKRPTFVSVDDKRMSGVEWSEDLFLLERNETNECFGWFGLVVERNVVAHLTTAPSSFEERSDSNVAIILLTNSLVTSYLTLQKP